jgi:hypothetical protein
VALLLPDCSFFGPALPEPFVKFELERLLRARDLLPDTRGESARILLADWEAYRRKLRALGEQGGERRVAGHVLEPLTAPLGYGDLIRAEEVVTREGPEDGGWVLTASDGSRLRAWAVAVGTDLDAPTRRGRAYRFSPARVVQRVLQAAGERVGLLTDGEELRVLLAHPARPDSHIAVRLDRSGGWRAAREIPYSYRLLLALASPAGVRAVPELVEAARLAQATVTAKLRLQARLAVEAFVQEVLDHPENAAAFAGHRDPQALARTLWSEGLVLVYRLLFVLKLESSADPARAFSFAATSLWRNTFSPNTALAPFARRVLDQGVETGGMLEQGLRTLFRLFVEGLRSSELRVSPLGGALFGPAAIPTLNGLAWGERAVARLLDHLLWTPGDGRAERERVHYGTLDVEDLGRVYEALLELEPGIATEPMARLRRAKLEVVLPAARALPYRAGPEAAGAPEALSGEEEEAEDDGSPGCAAGATRVRFVEDIPAGRFYVRVGLGRKATGSYYTPHPFVRFLVQETLGPQVTARSPPAEPQPAGILALKVLDPAMGSGHFLVEACRFLGDALYEACRLCDERAIEAEEKAAKAQDDAGRTTLLARAAELRARVEALPDPDDELVAYLPSRVAEGEASGLSQRKAEALCRRLVAVHCLYGVDKNPLAVELAKLSLWLESYAEGLPLTFLDHRLVQGDALTGPFFEHLLTWPRRGGPIEGIFEEGLTDRLTATLHAAVADVQALEASVGKDLADLEQKRIAKQRLDAALAPFKRLAAAWSGGVMLDEEADDAAYAALARAVAEGGDPDVVLAAHPKLREMVDVGKEGVAFDLVFPEVFWGEGDSGEQAAGKWERGTAGTEGRAIPSRRGGFHAVLGNPPWEAIRRHDNEFFAGYDLAALVGATKREKEAAYRRILARQDASAAYRRYIQAFEQQDRVTDRLFQVHQARVGGNLAGRGTYDAYMLFGERSACILNVRGRVGLVLPSGFHANEGATGLRRMYLEEMCTRCCYSFENRNKLFDIDSRFKFAVVVAENDPAGTRELDCAFYLHDLDWLFPPRAPMRYSLDFVRRTGGPYLSLIELRSPQDQAIADRSFAAGQTFATHAAAAAIRLSQEVNMTYEASRFMPTADLLPSGEDPRDPEVAAGLRERSYLPLHEGKTFHQYDDQWEDRPRYCVALTALADKPEWLKAARHYRLAFRDIARSTDERTGIFCLLPPGFIFGNKAPCERAPDQRPTGRALQVLAVADSFAFDFVLRTKVQATVNLFILNGCPFPRINATQERFFAHAALRLTCNHAGYAALWREQLGGEYRERGQGNGEQGAGNGDEGTGNGRMQPGRRTRHPPVPRSPFPILPGSDTRWSVRAAIDAVVAQAYGLTREQYAHVLASFSHRSYPKAPELCLAAFDELTAIGLEAFCRKHDPYWDVPLNENLPEPVIDLPTPREATESAAAEPRPAHEPSGQLSLFGPVASASRVGSPRSPFPVPFSPLPAAHRPAAPSRADQALDPDTYQLIALLLEERGTITSADAQTLTGLDAAGVRPYLQHLIADRRAIQEGQRRGTRYRSASRA